LKILTIPTIKSKSVCCVENIRIKYINFVLPFSFYLTKCLCLFRAKGKDFGKRANETPDLGSDLGNESSPPMNSTLISQDSQDVPVAKKSKKGIASKDNTKPRFRWTEELIDSLLACLNDEKTNAELKGLDFEADLVKLYGLIRKRMAEIHPDGGFGPVAITEIAEGLDTQELVKAKLRTEEENKAIKNGYERVKIKSKEIRQRYRKAVSEGTGKRSGSEFTTIGKLSNRYGEDLLQLVPLKFLSTLNC